MKSTRRASKVYDRLKRIIRVLRANSRLKVLYFISAGCNFFEKKEIGCQVLLIFCCNTPPTAASEASTMRQYGASEDGWVSIVALERVALVLSKAAMAASLR